MNFDYMNRMVQYIENNLDREIDFDQLSKITHTNLFILERIFLFLTDMTITEYIRKRRLSRAFEEIRNTDSKIIDIAFKYQYNFVSSFNRAFKQLFRITPTECRKGVGSYKIIPIEYFEPNQEKYNFDYEIKTFNSVVLYCYHITSKTHSDLLYKIRQLYQEVKANGRYDTFHEMGMYGIFSKEENSYNYYLGSTKDFSDLEKYQIQKNECAEFKLLSREQEKIVGLENKINKQWLPSTNYSVKDKIKIELYNGDNCFIYLPIQ